MVEALKSEENSQTKKIKLHSPNKQFFKLYGPMLSDTKVFLMRHALSELNEKCKDFKKEEDPKIAK
jgi:hypothetical protein